MADGRHSRSSTREDREDGARRHSHSRSRDRDRGYDRDRRSGDNFDGSGGDWQGHNSQGGGSIWRGRDRLSMYNSQGGGFAGGDWRGAHGRSSMYNS